MKAIPHSSMPQDIHNYEYEDEDMISLENYFHGEILTEPKYYLAGIQGAVSECRLRKSAVQLLEKAFQKLPSGLTFKIYDAWRPIEVQQSLYDGYYFKIKSLNSEWSAEKITEETKKFVSYPSYNINKPSVHNSGGAVDLTLCDIKTAEELEMGTAFDDFTEKAYTASFEKKENKNVKRNRRLLYWTMIDSGFTNYPTEWWHYDFGDAFWSFYTGNPAKYRGII